MGCGRYSAASRLEVLLDEDDFDLFHKLLNSEMFCFFTTACDSPGTLKSIFVLLFLLHQYGSPRTCLIFLNM